MAKAVYEPGELEKVRNRLGDLDRDEALRMAKKLGGEVGVEKAPAPEKITSTVKGGKFVPKHRVEVAIDETEAEDSASPNVNENALDIELPVKQNYKERVKMDKLAYQEEFDIKTFFQLVVSIFSFGGGHADNISPLFIKRRLPEYYKKIESLVISTRTLFPKNNAKRNDQLRKGSAFAYAILDTIRRWNIERISNELADMQANPRSVTLVNFKEILKAIYKPIVMLEKTTPETQIRASFNLIYKYLYVENPRDAKIYQSIVKTALTAYVGIIRDVKYLVYPLLMKLISEECLSYDIFFLQKRNRILAFLGLREEDILQSTNYAVYKGKSESGESSGDEEESDEEIAERRRKEEALAEEKVIVEKGLQALESIFPKAGWTKPYSDIYPYFAKMFEMKKGYEIIAPTDPMLWFAVLCRVLEELFFGLRAVNFTQINKSEGGLEDVNVEINNIINNWHDYIAKTLNKEYLERLVEYCELLESSPASRTSSFSIRLVDEMNLAKRLYFFPHYKYTIMSSLTNSSFQKKELNPIYREIRKLRRCLTYVVNDLEKAIEAGGAEANVLCDGIGNPWAKYVFQIANPVSRRLDIVLGQKKRTNAQLILFTFAIVTVLDFYVNNEKSWAYDPPSELLFRSVDGVGAIPQFGVDELLNADAIFKERIMEIRESRAAEKAKQAEESKAPAEESKAP